MKQTEQEYPKKSYKLFILWTVVLLTTVFVVVPVLNPILKSIGSSVLLLIKFVLLYALLQLLLLFYIIYKTERVYWVNGVTYECAKCATKLQRQTFALAHLKRFIWGFIAFLIYSVVSFVLGFNGMVDILVFMVVTVVTACSTIAIKL